MTEADGPRRLVPSWLARLAAIGWRVLAALALGIVLLYLGIILSTTVLSLLVGFVLAATLSPVAGRLRARGWSGIKAAGAVTGALVLGALGILALVFIGLRPYVEELVAAVTDAIDRIQSEFPDLPTGDGGHPLLGVVADRIGAWLQAEASALVGTIGTIATIAMLGVFMMFFLLADGDKAWSAASRGIDDWRRQRLTEAGADAIARSGGFLRRTGLVSFFRAAVVWVVLALVGVPFAATLAVSLFVAGFVPYVGPFLATVWIVFVAYASAGPLAALLLLLLIPVLTWVGLHVISPVRVGQTVALHPALVLIGLAIGASFGGVVGAILAVPTIGFLAAILGPLREVLGTHDRSGDVDADGIPMWLDRIGQWSWRGLVVVGLVLVAIGVAARVPLVVGPVVVGITIAATFLPALRNLEGRGMKRLTASLLLMIALWAGITIVATVSTAALADQAGLGDTSSAIPDDGGGPSSTIRAIVEAFTSGMAGTIVTAVERIVEAGVFLVLTALLSFYFLLDGRRAWGALMDRVGDWRRARLESAGARGASVLGGYMIATGILGGFNAITGFVIMVLLGLPLALPIAVLSFLGGFIPYIGQALTSLLAFLVAFKYGSTQDIIIMGLYTIIMNVVQGSFIAPLLYGRAVSIHPAIVLLAIPAGGELAGVLGMFLAVPVIGVFAAVWRSVLEVLGEEPAAPTPDAQAPPEPSVAASLDAATAPTGG